MGESVTLDQVLTLAGKLSVRDQVRLIELIAPQIERAIEPATIKPLYSLRGIWKGINITEQDIDEARREMWGSFGEREI